MENRKRRLSDIGRMSRVKVQKLELKSGINSYSIVNDETICELTSSNDTDFTSYCEQAEAFAKDIIKNNSKQLISDGLSVIDTLESGVNLKGQLYEKDHVKHKTRVYIRDDSGYQSDDFSDTEDTLKCEVLDRVNNKEDNCVPAKTQARATVVKKYDSHLRIDVEYAKNSCRNETDVQGSYSIDLDEDDDESDVIIPCDRSESILNNKQQPKNVDKRWTRYSLGSPVEKRLFKYGRLPRRNSLPTRLIHREIEPINKSTIYIQHEYADKPIGDELGVTVWTYLIKQEDGTGYYQHFFVDVVEDGPAKKMKIQNNDEIVLVNNTFVPQITHNDLLNLFRHVKVDGKTRFKLLVRRVEKVHHAGSREKWDWVESSAVLYPDVKDMEDKHPIVKEVQVSLHAENEIQIKFIKEYKIPDTQLYLGISNGKVIVDVKNNKNEETKRLCQHVRYQFCSEDHHYHYMAAISDENSSEYISVGPGNEIKLDQRPFWFEYNALSNNVCFKTHDVYLSCNIETRQLKVGPVKYYFDASSPDASFDHPDGCTSTTDYTSYFNPPSCSTMPVKRRNQSDRSSADVRTSIPVDSHCGDLSTQGTQSSPDADYTRGRCEGLEGQTNARNHEHRTNGETRINTNMRLDIPMSSTCSSSPSGLKTPSTPFASLFLAN